MAILSYQLDRTGRLISGRQSAVEKRVSTIQLDKESLKEAKITVETSFRFEQGNTTRISEIVPTNDRLYEQAYKQSATRGRESPIYSDFMEMIPPEYADEVQSLQKPYSPLPDDVFETQNPSFFHRIYQRLKRQ